MVSRALFPGRFQPFHRGHLAAVKYILGRVEEVVVAVTAAQFSYEPEDPFTAGERVTMAKLALGDLASRAYIVPVDNIPNNVLWPHHVLTRVPEVSVVFTNNTLVAMLFRKAGVTVEPIPLVERSVLQGRVVRRLIAEGGDWRRLVPEPVAEYIVAIGGVERIRSLVGSERAKKPRE